MKKQRGKFFTFLFSLIPGAGEMYLGFFKLGTSLMSLFIGSIICASMLFSPLILIAVIVWFYSFFHTNNLNHLSDQEFAVLEDDYLFHLSESSSLGEFIRKNKKLCSMVCILTGILVLYYTFTDTLILLMPDSFRYELERLFSFLPRTLIGIGCILAGYYLIRGKKMELFHENPEDDDSVEDDPADTTFFSETFQTADSQNSTGKASSTDSTAPEYSIEQKEERGL